MFSFLGLYQGKYCEQNAACSANVNGKDIFTVGYVKLLKLRRRKRNALSHVCQKNRSVFPLTSQCNNSKVFISIKRFFSIHCMAMPKLLLLLFKIDCYVLQLKFRYFCQFDLHTRVGH